jgi:hypothetical protein
MKAKYIAIMIALVYSEVLPQQASLRTQDVYSENRQYCIKVTGGFYEGFAGDQEILLMSAAGDTLWKKIVSGDCLILPSVSNNGDVAITHREIEIYDVKNKLKGKLPFQGKEDPYFVVDYQGAVQGFSVNGDRYLIFKFTGTKAHEVALVCLTDSAKRIWELALGAFSPHEILFYRDKVIVDDCGKAGMHYTNYCYVIDMDGNVRWQYRARPLKPSDWQIFLNRDKGILLAKDKSTEVQVKLDTLGYDRH